MALCEQCQQAIGDVWVVLGCGPTAAEDLSRARALAAGRPLKIATVNMGTRLLDAAPDAYGTFEADSFNVYRNVAALLGQAGVDLFTTRRNARRAGPSVPWGVVDGAFMPEPLRGLRDWSRFFEGDQPVGINAGVLMLLIVAERYRPAAILACGLNGYALDGPAYDAALLSGYAQFGARDAAADAAANQQMGADVEAITQHYAETEFVFMTRPAFWRETWRAQVAEMGRAA